ncbi:MAG TPA: hypothetical protein VFK28_03615 [Sphingomicrobium sp.]|nr:hypothetical protein [Sphingomicrobium sp.]
MAFGSVAASSQPASAPPSAPPPTPHNPGTSAGPLGGFHAPSNDPGAGLGESPGSFVGLGKLAAEKGMPKGAYGVELARRMKDAQELVDAVSHGRVLTERDVRRIRDLMREDFIAWRKRYDLLPSAYREERDRWIVEEQALSPNQWAQQRLDWLEAQRDWIVSHGG